MSRNKNKNIFKRYFDKSNKTIYDVSKETNIPEKKVQEIIDGDREITGENVDKVMSSLQNDNKVEKDINIINALEFFKENNPKELRDKFNYSTQKDFARVVGLSSAVISQFESGNYGPTRNEKGVGNNTLLKLYDFYRNELNINISRKNETNKKKANNAKIHNIVSVNKNNIAAYNSKLNKAIKYFKENPLTILLNKYNMTDKEFMYNTSMSYTVFRRFASGRFYKLPGEKDTRNFVGKNTIIKTYLYFKSLEKSAETQNKIKDEYAYNDTKMTNDLVNNIINDKEVDNKIIDKIEEATTNYVFDNTDIIEDVVNNVIENEKDTEKFKLDTNFDVNEVFEYIVYKCDSDKVIDLYNKLNNFFEIVKKFK